MKKIGCCLIVIFILNISVCGQVQFATVRLQSMANLLSLDIKNLELDKKEAFSYLGHPLNIRINKWNEIEHIGYRLFSNTIRENNPSPIYDFLERYFLEIDLLKDIDKSIRLAIDKIQLSNQDLGIIHTLNGTEDFKINMLNLKKYQVTWSKNGLNILTVTFDMDYQLLSGCNIIEAEKRLIKDLQRYQPEEHKKSKPDFPHITSNNQFWQEEFGSYILEEIHHTLYYKNNKENGWKLVEDISHPIWSTFNLMLSADTDNNYELEITIDLYGYDNKKIIIPLKKWIGFCHSQGCKSYLGIKTHNEKTITGTVFIVNEEMGYNHMLTIELNKDIITNHNGKIQSRLYTYIPLHNVSDNYFQFYSKTPNTNIQK